MHVSALVLVSEHKLELGVPDAENPTNLTKWPHRSPLSELVIVPG